ncbi:hypothetical protein NN561_004521 [Cricetulus griseus]
MREPEIPPERNWGTLGLGRGACHRAHTLQPLQRPKGPGSGKVIPTGTWRRGQSAPRTRDTRGRQNPPEPQAACSRRPRCSEGPIPRQHRPITPRSLCFGEDPPLPPPKLEVPTLQQLILCPI